MFTEKLDLFVIVFGLSFVVIVGTLLFVFSVFLKKKNSLMKSHYQEALESQKQRHHVELQALRSQMNPHFVHNSLNAVQYFIQRNEVELSEEYLSKFSKLIRSFFELSRKQFITIEEEVGLLNNYLAMEKMRFEEKLSYSIHLDPAIDTETQIPSMLLQPLVENAVNHGIFHKKGSGHIKVMFVKANPHQLKISVIDNGIGLTAAKALNKKTSNGVHQRSSGVFQDRLALLNSLDNWDITFLSERGENDLGTAVHLLFNFDTDD